jgi:hypothetical protein
MIGWHEGRKRWWVIRARAIAVLLVSLRCAGNASEPAGDNPHFDAPGVLTATVYAIDTGKPLFKFKRIATQTGSTLRVVREYSTLEGKVAAREHVEYEDNLPTRYELEELQTGAEGTVTFDRLPNEPAAGKIVFKYAATSHSNSSGRSEVLRPDTLLSDNVGPFLARHFEQMARGEKVTCRCVVITHRQTVGFTLKEESEGRWHDKDVITVRMEPSSFLISALVEPLHLVIEKAPPHRVLEYRGRTTPKAGRPGHWSDLDAVTVFDW